MIIGQGYPCGFGVIRQKARLYEPSYIKLRLKLKTRFPFFFSNVLPIIQIYGSWMLGATSRQSNATSCLAAPRVLCHKLGPKTN